MAVGNHGTRSCRRRGTGPKEPHKPSFSAGGWQWAQGPAAEVVYCWRAVLGLWVRLPGFPGADQVGVSGIRGRGERRPPGVDAVITLPRGGEVTCASSIPPASCWSTSIKINTGKTHKQRKGKIHFPPKIGGTRMSEIWIEKTSSSCAVL